MTIPISRGRPWHSPVADHRARGFTLLELMLALALGTVVIGALVVAVQGMTRTIQLQNNLAGLQLAARQGEVHLRTAIEGAGYHPAPWNGGEGTALISGQDARAPASDRLHLSRWSRSNCLGADNPVRDTAGKPAWYQREESFRVRPDGRLALTCWYGPEGGPAVRQLNGATLIEGVETLQILLAEDQDRDGRPDRWVPPGAWHDESRIIGARYALLLRSRQALPGARGTPSSLATDGWTPPADGRLRLLVRNTISLQGRQP